MIQDLKIWESFALQPTTPATSLVVKNACNVQCSRMLVVKTYSQTDTGR